jgi:hypothetical protein
MMAMELSSSHYHFLFGEPSFASSTRTSIAINIFEQTRQPQPQWSQ